MNTNHAKAIKGMSIANIVLGILVILGSMGGCAALGFGGYAMTGYDYIPLDNGTYLDAAAAASIPVVLSVLSALVAICGILVLIAGIMGVRGADRPEKLKGVMIWNIVGAIASFCGAGIISLVLCIVVAVFASKDKNAFAAGAYAAGAPYGAPVYGTAPVPPAPMAPQQPAGAPVASQPAAAPVAPAAPEAAPLVSDPAPVTPTAAVATEAIVTEAAATPAPAEVAAVVEQAEAAAAAQADPAIVLPDNYIEDAQAGVTVVEEAPAEGAEAPSESKEN